MAGNGRHVEAILANGHDAICLDWSRPAARIIRSRYPAAATVVADATHLPLADASVGASVCVAGLPSIPNAQARAAAWRELHRVLIPGGRAQITVWSRHAPRFRGDGPPDQPFDAVVPWRSDGEMRARQYHLYTPASLAAAATQTGFQVVSQSEVALATDEPDNLVIEVQK